MTMIGFATWLLLYIRIYKLTINKVEYDREEQINALSPPLVFPQVIYITVYLFLFFD